MTETNTRLDPKQLFGWKAAWFSLLAPLATALGVFVSFCLLYHFTSDKTQASVDKLILGGALIIEFVSLTMAIAGGLIANSYWAKGIAAIGFLLSLGLAFFTLILLGIEMGRFGVC